MMSIKNWCGDVSNTPGKITRTFKLYSSYNSTVYGQQCAIPVDKGKPDPNEDVSACYLV